MPVQQLLPIERLSSLFGRNVLRRARRRAIGSSCDVGSWFHRAWQQFVSGGHHPRPKRPPKRIAGPAKSLPEGMAARIVMSGCMPDSIQEKGSVRIRLPDISSRSRLRPRCKRPATAAGVFSSCWPTSASGRPCKWCRTIASRCSCGKLVNASARSKQLLGSHRLLAGRRLHRRQPAIDARERVVRLPIERPFAGDVALGRRQPANGVGQVIGQNLPQPRHALRFRRAAELRLLLMSVQQRLLHDVRRIEPSPMPRPMCDRASRYK